MSNHYKLPNKAPPHDPYSYAPIELDAVHHKGRFTKGRNNKKRKALKCYACGKLGHMARDCVTTQEEHGLYILTESSRQDTGQKYQTA